jgi:hypothetical protein
MSISFAFKRASSSGAQAPRHVLRALLTTLLLPALGGCMAEVGDTLTAEQEEQAVEGQANFFTNQPNFVNCAAPGTAARVKLEQGLEILTDRIYENGGRSFRTCLGDSFIGPLTSPNGIWAQYNRSAVTRIECVNNLAASCGSAGDGDWWGCASVGIDGESIRIANQALLDNGVSATTLAGLVAHELAHNYGHRHPGEGREYDSSIPQRARMCVTNGNALPDHHSRTRNMPGEVEIGSYGGWGGSPVETGCSSSFIDALRVRSGGEIDALQTSCETSDSFNSWFGGTGGTLAPASATACDAGEVLVGIRGRSGGRLDALQMVCAPISNTSARENLTTLGGGGGTVFESYCPSGKAVKRLRLRAGGKIDQIQLVCDGPSNRAPNAHAEGVVDGGQFDPMFTQRCSGDGALRSLIGRAGARIDRLFGSCRTTTHSPTFALGSIEHTLAPVLGGTGGGAFESRCSSSELMVGVRARAGGRIDAVGAICAPAVDWANGITAGAHNLALNGGTGGSLVTKRCDAGEFLVGFNLFAGGEVTGLQTVCRDLKP